MDTEAESIYDKDAERLAEEDSFSVMLFDTHHA
jgi:hypothetical protein